jgi:hypothetical protein
MGAILNAFHYKLFSWTFAFVFHLNRISVPLLFRCAMYVHTHGVFEYEQNMKRLESEMKDELQRHLFYYKISLKFWRNCTTTLVNSDLNETADTLLIKQKIGIQILHILLHIYDAPWLLYLQNEINCCAADHCWLLILNNDEIQLNNNAGFENTDMSQLGP